MLRGALVSGRVGGSELIGRVLLGSGTFRNLGPLMQTLLCEPMHLLRCVGLAGTRRPNELSLLLRPRYISVWQLLMSDRVSVALSTENRGLSVVQLL